MADYLFFGIELSHWVVAVAGGLLAVRNRKVSRIRKERLCLATDLLITLFVSVVGAVLLGPAALLWFGLPPDLLIGMIFLLALTLDGLTMALVRMNPKELLLRLMGQGPGGK
ncbi:hypothetical protein [Pseudogemmobacter bohemicus]|uniref:hypothetical protein n=1 Tax=Pseudogemmobacter bohemicus TaxID=2250708 RepID=UPI001300B0A4|nr:hypothetical protein [Pseudogemmobacter bohemicus]